MATTTTYTLVLDACTDRSPGSCRSHQIDLSERFIAEIALIAMALIQSRLDLGRIDSRVCVLFCLVQPFPPTLLCAIYFIERQSVIVFHSYIHTHTRWLFCVAVHALPSLESSLFRREKKSVCAKLSESHYLRVISRKYDGIDHHSAHTSHPRWLHGRVLFRLRERCASLTQKKLNER